MACTAGTIYFQRGPGLCEGGVLGKARSSLRRMDITSGASLDSVDGSNGWSISMAAMSLNLQRADGTAVLQLEQSAIPAERYGLGQNVNLLA